MRIFTSLSDVPADFGPSVVTIGKFDGMHEGHRAMVHRLRTTAAARGLASVVVTFDRNPLSLLRPEVCPEPLVSTEQKLDLLAATDPDATLVLTFDRSLAEETPEEFVRTVLVEPLRAAVVLVGADFRFGAKGAGSVETLIELGATHGFEVLVVDDVTAVDGRRVSSSWIRELLSEGRVAEAARLLGAPHTIRGTVVHGHQRGRQLGYPTANLSREVDGFVPADGVYAAWLTARDIRYPAAVSIGNNPTFEGIVDRQIEAHAIDAAFDIYDEVVDVSFVEYIRGMRKFPGPDELAVQMGADEDQIRTILGVPPKAHQ
ncbi:MAG TPA: bifunctional riboflavin kinase/FAD synthetase [Rhodoglobus sp.]|nr:bifunctional riboflavin kinase/FAD synthetase [Rhodoglobus sp.]HPM51578.1 bifunctional riboflavin kinase/FAD synthetase [Rhodoglobus sp.]